MLIRHAGRLEWDDSDVPGGRRGCRRPPSAAAHSQDRTHPEQEDAMHIQIVNFKLKDLSDADYRKAAAQLAGAFADVDGLVSKEWLANPDTNTYGGVYHWRDRAAMETYTASELCNSVATHPNLVEITSTDFEVIEEPTRITRGNL
jgi:heme-degrading monooxygenase HmoA